MKQRKSYWIECDIYYCPICTRETKYCARVYDRPRPEQWHERNRIKEVWDYCDAF